jgi:hypothetical protein
MKLEKVMRSVISLGSSIRALNGRDLSSMIDQHLSNLMRTNDPVHAF